MHNLRRPVFLHSLVVCALLALSVLSTGCGQGSPDPITVGQSTPPKPDPGPKKPEQIRLSSQMQIMEHLSDIAALVPLLENPGPTRELGCGKYYALPGREFLQIETRIPCASSSKMPAPKGSYTVEGLQRFRYATGGGFTVDGQWTVKIATGAGTSSYRLTRASRIGAPTKSGDKKIFEIESDEFVERLAAKSETLWSLEGATYVSLSETGVVTIEPHSFWSAKTANLIVRALSTVTFRGDCRIPQGRFSWTANRPTAGAKGEIQAAEKGLEAVEGSAATWPACPSHGLTGLLRVLSHASGVVADAANKSF